MAMNMRGSLNLSKFQKPNSNSPRFYGRAIIEGKTYNLKGWEKEGKDGPWISLLFEPLEAVEDDEFEQCVPKKSGIFSSPEPTPPVPAKKTRQAPQYQPGDFDDDIPF